MTNWFPTRYCQRACVVCTAILGFGLTSTALAQNRLRPNVLPLADATPLRPQAVPEARQTASAGAPSSKQAQLLLNEALQLSKSARAVEALTQIIELCNQATSKSLTAEETRYALDLTAWALNKRGEAYAAQAADFMKEGAEKDAANLDRQALEDFTAAVKLDPKRWKAVHNRGVSHGVLGLHDDAIADFTRVVELKPDYANAWFNRAEIHAENARFAQAVSDYSEVIKLKPDDGTAYRQRGRAYSATAKHKEAVADFNAALELERRDIVALIERGEAQTRLGDWGAAASDFRLALEIDPDSAEAYRSAAWLMATCPQVKYRNTKSAVEAAEQAVELAAHYATLDFSYQDTLAAAYANASRFDDAAKVVAQAIPKAPAADAAMMRKRLALYQNRRPFRDAPAVAVQPASAKVRKR